MTDHPAYELVPTPPARRAITDQLQDAVATAVINFLNSALVADPHRMGKPLRNDLAGVWSARRGTCRVLYRIDDELHEVVNLRVEHRRDAYRPLSRNSGPDSRSRTDPT